MAWTDKDRFGLGAKPLTSKFNCHLLTDIYVLVYESLCIKKKIK